MEPHKVSVIIPSYNMANFLGEAIQGILNQTYQNFEIIVVNDASTDNTNQVMQQFDDPRVKYIVHPENRYAAAARNTGIQAAEGDLIAFVDADDKVHAEKLATQVGFLERHPEIGLVYCSRIEIDERGNSLALVPASAVATLKDLILGYPYAPSEIVMRREWIDRVGLFDETFRYNAEDPDFHRRLALHGCRMAGVQRVLNYRRLRTGRVYRNLPLVVEDQLRSFENTFTSPLCPADVIALRERSLGMIHRILSFLAFSQNDTSLGQELIRRAMELDGRFFANDPNKYVMFLVRSSVRNGGDHEAILKTIVPQLPPEVEWKDHYTNFAIGYGYLLNWARDFLWRRIDSGLQNFAEARSYGLEPHERFLELLAGDLLNYESEFGSDAAQDALNRFVSHLINSGNSAGARKLTGNYRINMAFRQYTAGEHKKAIPNAFHAIRSDPSYLANRGVLSMLVQSTIGLFHAVG